MVSEASVEDAAELSAFAAMTYVAAFGAEFEDPAELKHHLDTTLSVDAWLRYFASDRVFVADEDGRLAGYLQLGPAEQAGEFEIHRLYVDPEMQSQGIGAALMRHVLDDDAVRRAPAVWLDVWENNHRAHKFYTRWGFAFTSERRPFVLRSGAIDGYDLIMVRRPPVLPGAIG